MNLHFTEHARQRLTNCVTSAVARWFCRARRLLSTVSRRAVPTGHGRRAVIRWKCHSQRHSLVPCVAHGGRIRGAENAKPPQKNSLLGCHEPIKTRDRWLKEPCDLPVVEWNIERPGATCGGNSADHSILLKVEENKCRPDFTRGPRSERKLTDKNLSKHVSGRNRKRHPPANPHGETVGRHPSATRHRRSVPQ